jgi:ATP-dependent DNA ligase
MIAVNQKSIRYKLDSKDLPRQWQCWFSTNSEGSWGIYTTSKEMNIGKANYMNFEMQAQAMCIAEIGKKERSGYFLTIQEATDNKVFMPTGCPSGMIWEEYMNQPHVVFPALGSGKLDGSKTLSMLRFGRTYLSTRSGKEHLNFRHIQEALDEFHRENPNIVLDGEAYNHEYADRFEDLQSIFRQSKPTDEERQLSKDVAKFYVYDAVDKNNPLMTAMERQALLSTIFEKLDSPYLVYWPSFIMNSMEKYDAFHEKCMDEGYEGTVLKIASAHYRNSKNKFVMKRKPKFDCEFLILSIVEGEGTASGTAQKMMIDLTTVIGMNDDHFKQLQATHQLAGMARGWDHKKLAVMLKNPTDYIGRMGTFEYGGITNHGKLRFPKFKALRDGQD